MMYSINYDLKKPGRNYNSLYSEIKTLGHWNHCLDSTWLVETSLSAQAIYSKLEQHIDTNDHMLIIGLTADYAGWMPQTVWDWIKHHKQNPAFIRQF
jgi:hypothetical protein